MSARHVMDQGGVVRNIEYWGTQTLPQVMRRHKKSQTVGESVLIQRFISVSDSMFQLLDHVL